MIIESEEKLINPQREYYPMKAALVGRHQLLKIQEEVIRRAGLEIIKQIPQIPNEPQQLQQFIQQLKQENVQALVIQALPPQLIAQLLPHFQIFSLKMEAVAVTESLQEAQKIVNEKPEVIEAEIEEVKKEERKREEEILDEVIQEKTEKEVRNDLGKVNKVTERKSEVEDLFSTQK